MDRANGLRAVLFDWDGTLVDSAAKSYRCYLHAFSPHGIVFDEATFARTYSPDWYHTYRAVGLPQEAWRDADARWLECYEREPSRLVPGAHEVLSRLAGRDLLRGLVSSGDPTRVRREIETLGVAHHFSTVVCGGETRERKPHPEPLLVALGTIGVTPAEAAYVGDSPEDVQMARAAGAFAVGVPGGFPNRDALERSSPHLLADDLESAVSALLG